MIKANYCFKPKQKYGSSKQLETFVYPWIPQHKHNEHT